MSQKVIALVAGHACHGRPILAITTVAKRFPDDIAIRKEGSDGGVADARSMMEVMLLRILPGNRLVVTADGPSAEQAASTLAALLSASEEEADDLFRRFRGKD